jgi:hypothetical protein
VDGVVVPDSGQGNGLLVGSPVRAATGTSTAGERAPPMTLPRLSSTGAGTAVSPTDWPANNGGADAARPVSTHRCN